MWLNSIGFTRVDISPLYIWFSSQVNWCHSFINALNKVLESSVIKPGHFKAKTIHCSKSMLYEICNWSLKSTARSRVNLLWCWYVVPRQPWWSTSSLFRLSSPVLSLFSSPSSSTSSSPSSSTLVVPLLPPGLSSPVLSLSPSCHLHSPAHCNPLLHQLLSESPAFIPPPWNMAAVSGEIDTTAYLYCCSLPLELYVTRESHANFPMTIQTVTYMGPAPGGT